MTLFVIEDERHADRMGQFASRDEAITELHRLAALPWDQQPNVAPCGDWQSCGRSYEIIEYDMSQESCRELSRTAVLDISADGVRWL